MSAGHGGWKRVMDPLELLLEMIVSHVGTYGEAMWVLVGYLRGILSALNSEPSL